MFDDQRVLRLPEVIHRVGLARATIYLKIKNDDFPKPIRLGGQAVGFLESEISEWVSKRTQISREGSDIFESNSMQRGLFDEKKSE